MIRFYETVSLEIKSTSITVSIDGKEPVVVRGKNIPSIVARLLDSFTWEKIIMCHELVRDNFQWLGDAPIPPEHKYDYDEDNSLIIVLRKEERVKSFLDRQPLPARLLNALPVEVKRELFITKKQFQFIQFLTEGLDVMISERELHSLTKKEASALIKYLQALQTNPTP